MSGRCCLAARSMRRVSFSPHHSAHARHQKARVERSDSHAHAANLGKGAHNSIALVRCGTQTGELLGVLGEVERVGGDKRGIELAILPVVHEHLDALASGDGKVMTAVGAYKLVEGQVVLVESTPAAGGRFAPQRPRPHPAGASF